MERDAAAQQLMDAEHLRLLRIGYYIAAATTSFFVVFPLIYVVVGVMVFLAPTEANNDTRWVGLLVAAFGAGVSLLMAVVTVMKFLTARSLGQHRRRTLCLITAGITCLAMPYGTAIGIGTIVVLQRPTVIALFERREGT